MTLRITIGIATLGRPEILLATLRHAAGQTRQPDAVIICPAQPADVAPETEASFSFPVCIVIGRKGLTSQRNRIIEATGETDILLFLDDDFFMAPDYLAELSALFIEQTDIVVATGAVLADGISSAGIEPAEADVILQQNAQPPREVAPMAAYNAYGCNMAIRMAPVRQHGLRFDETLPLYGWLEDVDFSRRLAPYGKIVKSPSLCGVHLGVKSGRNSGLKFGYSQIANPLYMVRKRTLSPARALAQISRNLCMNRLKLRAPEPWIDRAGRWRGNRLALADMLRGRLSPQRILEMD